jgi:hypothetical protein
MTDGLALVRRSQKGASRRYRMASLRRLPLLLALALPIGLAPACSPNMSTKGQLIECTVGAGGALSSCAPTTETETTDPTKCIDIDEDGDDDPHDDADEADDGADALRLISPSDADPDDDNDGTPDSTDDDDDNDGVDDTDDCDEVEGGDDYDALR